MKTNKVTSVEDYKIVSSFQSLRKTLLDERFADRLEKPLAYWALPNDRRLPLAFLGRTIKDLLATPFEELSATPGIGQKKISSLVKLLSRATKDHPPAAPFGLTELSETKKDSATERNRQQGDCGGFDPTVVSEALWSQWQQTVIDHGIGREKLGRLAPTLQALPTVIWHTQLDCYVDHTVAEIRQLKTHGEKRGARRARGVLHRPRDAVGRRISVAIVAANRAEVHTADRRLDCEGHARRRVPTPDEVREHLTVPLLEQIQIDAGETIHELSAGRLGVEGNPQSVRQQAKRMGVTRARVYQLLEECSRVMEVRWPEGNHQLAQLEAKLHTEHADTGDLTLFRATRELFYPSKGQLIDDEAAG